MNLQQQERFYQMMTRLKANSRGASTTEDKRITEVINGVITTRPAKKIEYLSDSETKASEPVIIDLQQKSKAGSAFVQENKLREIIRFQRSNGRL